VRPLTIPNLDENGSALFAVPLSAAGTGVKNFITVKVARDVKGVSEFTSAEVTNHAAMTWEMGER
jgi:hypothetical protein